MHISRDYMLVYYFSSLIVYFFLLYNYFMYLCSFSSSSPLLCIRGRRQGAATGSCRRVGDPAIVGC